MTHLTPLGSKVTISFKVRFRVGISASHYGANGAIYIAAIGVPDAASNCYLHKGMHADVKGSALMQVTIASCVRHSNGARACPDPL